MEGLLTKFKNILYQFLYRFRQFDHQNANIRAHTQINPTKQPKRLTTNKCLQLMFHSILHVQKKDIRAVARFHIHDTGCLKNLDSDPMKLSAPKLGKPQIAKRIRLCTYNITSINERIEATVTAKQLLFFHVKALHFSQKPLILILGFLYFTSKRRHLYNHDHFF